MAAGPWALRSGASLQRTLATSVVQARQAILGHKPSEGRNAKSFSELKKLRKSGWIGPKVADYFPTPDPVVKHPIMRMAHDSERVAALEARKNTGRGVPKKGEGKRSGKK